MGQVHRGALTLFFAALRFTSVDAFYVVTNFDAVVCDIWVLISVVLLSCFGDCLLTLPLGSLQ